MFILSWCFAPKGFSWCAKLNVCIVFSNTANFFLRQPIFLLHAINGSNHIRESNRFEIVLSGFALLAIQWPFDKYYLLLHYHLVFFLRLLSLCSAIYSSLWSLWDAPFVGNSPDQKPSFTMTFLAMWISLFRYDSYYSWWLQNHPLGACFASLGDQYLHEEWGDAVNMKILSSDLIVSMEHPAIVLTLIFMTFFEGFFFLLCWIKYWKQQLRPHLEFNAWCDANT